MKRRKFIRQASLGLGSMLPVVNSLKALEINTGPHFTTGIKIGEVTETSAIIWARLAKNSSPVGKQALIPIVRYLDEANGEWHPVSYFKEKYKQDRPDRKVQLTYPDGYNINNIEGAVPGMPGEIRILHRKKSDSHWITGEWKRVELLADYSNQIKLQNLQPGTAYQIKVEGRAANSKSTSAVLTGKFATVENAGSLKPIHFMVTTCHEYNDQDDAGGFKIYKHMQALNPDFMVHTGDVLYYDHLAKNKDLAHWHWQRMFGLRNCVEFYKEVPCYFMKDDHDTWMNDCYPQSANRFMGDFTFKQGVTIFKQQVPASNKPYRTFRWGKDVQIWLVEGREYRSDNTIEDGPDKSIWGKEQMEWFKRTFNGSDATFRLLISASPVVGPDRPQKKDNHANSGFTWEGNEIRQFMAAHKNTFVICGDRHWQYVSKDSKTGLMEFSCGPASNEHAGGWNKDNVLPEHQYLNIVGGFLGVNINRQNNQPSISFTHYSVDGEKLFSKTFGSIA